MQGILQSLLMGCPVCLGDQNRPACRQPRKKSHHHIDNLRRGAAHTGQGFLSGKLPHNHRIHRIIKLLKKGADQNREEENQ